MSRTLALFGLCLGLFSAACQEPPPPSIELIEAQVEAIGEPPFDPAREQEPGYIEIYKAKQHALYQQKATLLLQVARHHLNDPRMPDLMNRRWLFLGWNQEPADVAGEILADPFRPLLPMIKEEEWQVDLLAITGTRRAWHLT